MKIPHMWIASYPKSGSTWMRILIREYYKAKESRQPFESKDTATYWYQLVSPKPMSALSQEDVALLRSAAMSHLMTFAEGYSSQFPAIVIKTHLPCARYAEVPFFSPVWMSKALYIYRDPRDVLPSFAHHMGMEIDDAADKMNHPHSTLGQSPKVPIPISTWSSHVESWLGYSKVPVLGISYEDMHSDTSGSLRKALEFFDVKNIDEASIQRAVEESTFDKLSARERGEGFVEQSKNNDHFFRRGIVGSHRDEVSDEIREKIESEHKHAMRYLGYL